MGMARVGSSLPASEEKEVGEKKTNCELENCLSLPLWGKLACPTN